MLGPSEKCWALQIHPWDKEKPPKWGEVPVRLCFGLSHPPTGSREGAE